MSSSAWYLHNLVTPWSRRLAAATLRQVARCGACPDIGCLYLHGNSITSLKQIDELAGLAKLRVLTLHGNPVEEKKGEPLLLLPLTRPAPARIRRAVTTPTNCQANSCPCCSPCHRAAYRLEVIARLPGLKKLDHSVVTSGERKAADLHQRNKPRRVAKDA